MEYLGYIALIGLAFLIFMFILNKKKVPVKHYIMLAVIGGVLAVFASFVLEIFGDIVLRFVF